VTVVTGGGHGLGRAIALALAPSSAAVAVLGRNVDALAETEARLRRAGVHAFHTFCDVRDPASVQEAHARVQADLGAATVLVNNAGVAPTAPVLRLSLEDWQRALDVNATAALLCIQAWAPAMCEAGWGRVVNIASMAGLQGGVYLAAYAASKHALVGLTRAAAADLAPKGVTVNAICPGYVDTDMTDGGVQRLVRARGVSEAEALDMVLASADQARLLSTEEVAARVVHLCGEDAGDTTGKAIAMTGGSRTP